MSAYKYFFIRSSNDEFIPIGEFSRNTEVYRYCAAPFEQIKELTISTLERRIGDVQVHINSVKEGIQKDKDRKELIVRMNNPIEEKMEILHEIDCSIKENTDYIGKLTYASNYFSFLVNILDYAQACEIDRHIYVGEEIPAPTLSDITNGQFN